MIQKTLEAVQRARLIDLIISSKYYSEFFFFIVLAHLILMIDYGLLYHTHFVDEGAEDL